MDLLECAEILEDGDGVSLSENDTELFASAKKQYDEQTGLYDDFSIEFMQLPAAAVSVYSQSSATTDGMVSEDTNSVSSSMRSHSRSGRRAITPTILDILRENNSSSPSNQTTSSSQNENENTNTNNKRKSNFISIPSVRRLLVPDTDRPSTTTKRMFSSIAPCSSPLKRHRKDTSSSSSSFVLCKPKASRQQDTFATRIGFEEKDRTSYEKQHEEEEVVVVAEKEQKKKKKKSRKKKNSMKKKHHLQHVRPHVFTSPTKSSRLVQLRPEMLCESPVEPLSRKQVSPSHKERRLEDKNASTVVLVTRPAKSFDRPWPVRKTAFRHRLSHLPYSKEKTTTPDLTIETTLKEEESDESRMKKRTTTSLYCPQPKRSTSPFMSLREVNERINSPTLQVDSRKPFSFSHFDTPTLSSTQKNAEGGSFTVLPLSQSKKVRRQMEVVRGTRRIRTVIGETKLAIPESRDSKSSSSSATSTKRKTKSRRIRYQGSRRPPKKV